MDPSRHHAEVEKYGQIADSLQNTKIVAYSVQFANGKIEVVKTDQLNDILQRPKGQMSDPLRYYHSPPILCVVALYSEPKEYGVVEKGYDPYRPVL